ncbi:hypothetical protein M405DRAFT_864710 [Rhizopogon salebrosus TDB-379]|nr:hypothetical protein M405DRAFT_864710 [Rhizopogon salebrosus TDB-379]
MLRGYMMLTCAVDCISNHRALFTGALPVQAHANRLKFYKLPVELKVTTVDFGATREYKKEFMDDWLRLQPAASEDRTTCAEVSRSLGYLTGEENEIILDAH